MGRPHRLLGRPNRSVSHEQDFMDGMRFVEEVKMPNARDVSCVTLVILPTIFGCSPDEDFADFEAGECASSAGDETGRAETGTSAATGGADDAHDGGAASSETAGESPGSIPCDVAETLGEYCWGCHGATPSFGAPMSLTSLEDFVLPAFTDATADVSELVLQRLFDPERPMPATGMPEAHRDVLAAWIEGGLQPATTECDPGSDTDDAGEIGPEALPCEPTYVFTAIGDEGKDSSFEVPIVDDVYECFTFQPEIQVPTQATAWAPIIDDERVVHHWILYRSAQDLPDGERGSCSMPSDATFVAGWSPGGANFEMPADVGLEFAQPGDSFILEVHYNNTAGYEDVRDRSGVAVCTTEEPRPTEAAVMTIGSLRIAIPPGAQSHEVEGTCTGTTALPEPLHVISASPHMHKLGRSFRTEILRAGQEDDIDTLIHLPQYDFNSQGFYPLEPEVIIRPGDVLRTTCVYDNPTDSWVFLGEGTGDEMCFNFSIVYPTRALGDLRRCVVQ